MTDSCENGNEQLSSKKKNEFSLLVKCRLYETEVNTYVLLNS
jgi:hypothetical protein